MEKNDFAIKIDLLNQYHSRDLYSILVINMYKCEFMHVYIHTFVCACEWCMCVCVC